MGVASMGIQILGRGSCNLLDTKYITESMILEGAGSEKFRAPHPPWETVYYYQHFHDLSLFWYLAEYNWEASHFSKVAAADESHDQSLPLHHDDVIIKAVPVQQHMHSEQEQVGVVWNRVEV